MSEAPCCTCELTPDGIVNLTMLAGADVTLSDAREVVTLARRVAGGDIRPLLVDMRRMRSLERGAREHFKSEEATSSFARVALLTDSPLSRVLASFFLTLGEHRLPTRMFTDEAAARSWLGAHS